MDGSSTAMYGLTTHIGRGGALGRGNPHGGRAALWLQSTAMPSTPTANRTVPPVPRWPHVHALDRRPRCDKKQLLNVSSLPKTQHYGI